VTELVIAAIAAFGVWVALSRRRSGRSRLSQQLAALNPETETRGRRHNAGHYFAALGRRLPGDRNAITTSLASAGLEETSPEAVIGARFVAAAIGLVVGIFLRPVALVAVPGLAFVGYRLPDLLIGARVKGRKDDLARDLPDAVDLLAVCTQAGLNLPLSLKRVAAGVPGPLGQELRRTVREIELGLPRSAALGELSERNDVPELENLVGILQTSERFGTKVASSLNTFSADIRLHRKRRAEEQARRAPVKMLFPLVFLILPGFVLLTLVPLLLSTFQSLGF
jgi:tight adherence protein C